MAVKKTLLAIVGPTASGKSRLATEIARRTGSQILSADSMQVYRGMDLGTAKPTSAERAEVVHHLIDIVDPTESFTVARFMELADGIIAWRDGNDSLESLLEEAVTPGGIAAATVNQTDVAGYGRAIRQGVGAGLRRARANAGK